MKILITILLLFNFNIYGQNTKVTKGKILDENTNIPIPFAAITNGNHIRISDFNGFYSFDTILFDTNSIDVFVAHYKAKFSKVELKNDTLIIKLTPDTFDLELTAEFYSKPIDTIFYNNGNIKQINYSDNESICFYQNSKVKSVSTDVISRTYYINGVIKYQSVTYNPHMYKITEWFKNGKLKKHSKMIWSKSEKSDGGSFQEHKIW